MASDLNGNCACVRRLQMVVCLSDIWLALTVVTTCIVTVVFFVGTFEIVAHDDCEGTESARMFTQNETDTHKKDKYTRRAQTLWRCVSSWDSRVPKWRLLAPLDLDACAVCRFWLHSRRRSEHDFLSVLTPAFAHRTNFTPSSSLPLLTCPLKYTFYSAVPNSQCLVHHLVGICLPYRCFRVKLACLFA
jgi:hypothetical protein